MFQGIPFTVALLGATALAQTATVTIPASQDATIYRLTAPVCGNLGGTAANGAGQFLVANVDECNEEYNAHPLVRFDVASVVPAGSTIVSASLALDVVQVNWGLWSYLYPAAESWTEGAADPADPEWAGAPPLAGDVTWVYRSAPTLAWSAGPIQSSHDGIVPSPLGIGPWSVPSSAARVSRVQSWLDVPSSNHGWILQAYDQMRFASREHPTLAGPRLVVVYDPPCASPTSYCVGAPNSAGSGATLGMSGSASIAQNNCTVTLTGGVPNSFGFFFYGNLQQQIPWGNGFLCVDGNLFRLLPATPFSPAGTAARALDFTQGSTSQITAGSTWSFQCKYRDIAGGGARFNSSNGLAITFCP
jgi:hypothetical protein